MASFNDYACIGGLEHKIPFGGYCERCGLILNSNRTRVRNSLSTTQKAKLIPKLLEKQRNRCHYCKVEFCEVVPPTIDHVIPRSRGGTNAASNLVLACQICNWEKGSLMPCEMDQ